MLLHGHKLPVNPIIYYTPKRITSWRGPTLRHCARATQLFSKKCLFLSIIPIGVARIFDWGGGPNHKSHAMTSSETSIEEFLWGQRYCRMEDQKPWAGVGT